jgi:hypothetical protein
MGKAGGALLGRRFWTSGVVVMGLAVSAFTAHAINCRNCGRASWLAIFRVRG